MQDDSKITTPQESAEGGKSELFSEDVVTLSHNQNVAKEVLDDVFRISRPQTINDMQVISSKSMSMYYICIRLFGKFVQLIYC